ncbi:MAG: PTS mannitol transporter subunit IICBA [Lachnospiraceae bacterium]|jgi:PTS system mannitol-specific IIC component|nr:PTS mannitol transporter subunit IICBA [Lachnospiraceae bacterium]
MKNGVQRFGKFLSAMIMPNIGALIAFGFLAAFFNGSGWIPHEGFATIFSAILVYLIPILIASTGGKLIGGERGGVVAAIAVVGAIMSDPNTTMLMAAMIMGPLAGFCIKKFDEAMDGRMPAGFEMLINNFSVGILGMLLAMFGFLAVGPFMNLILGVLSAGVTFLVEHSVLPLIAIFIEPAKVLFLNNALNHGIFTPIATAQAAETGRSIMYMLEANPGPGLGVLLAYMFFCKDKETKQSAPGAVIIHLLGGIHEIYFPYILMNPLVIVGPILGNMAAILWFNITGCGLVGPASPGSIIAYLMMAPGDKMFQIIIGVVIATAISFVVSSAIVRMSKGKSLEEAQEEMASRKAQAKGTAAPVAITSAEGVKKVVFACDAGMGSSAMGATKFRNRVKASRPDLTVINTSVDTIPADCDIAVVQVTLVDRARKCVPNAQMVTINNFLADPALDSLYAQLTAAGGAGQPQTASQAQPVSSAASSGSKQILVKEGIKLNLPSVSKEEAIQAAGELLTKLGYVDASYVDAMQEREKLVTTYMGLGVAIPHGTSQAKGTVKKTGIVVMQYPEGVVFGDEKAQLVFGIAGVGDEHLELLEKICGMLEDDQVLEEFKTTNNIGWVLEKLK